MAKRKTVRKNYIITPSSSAWIAQMAEEDEVSETAMFERLIREEAKRRKLPKPSKERGEL